MNDAGKEPRWRPDRLALWLAVGAIFYSPLAYGATTPVTKAVLDAWMVLSALLLLAHRGGTHLAQVPPSLPLAVIGVVLAGASFLANPRFRYDSRLDFLEPVPGAFAWMPGSYDWARSLPEVLHFGALAVFLVALTGFCAVPGRRWVLLRAVALAGFFVALTGIFQKASGAAIMCWSDLAYSRTFFAAFRYDGNAASFLNLCWPASLALLLRSLERNRRRPLEASVWVTSLFFSFGALFMNSSTFGHYAAVPAALLGLALFRHHLPRMGGRAGSRAWLLGIVAFAALALLSIFRADIVSDRWSEAFAIGGSGHGRLSAYRAALALMASESGLLGVGPGCFGIVFPYYLIFAGAEVGGFWTHAHHDLLQVVIEWGALGGGAILFLFGGAVWRLLRKSRHILSRSRSLSVAAALLALLVVAAHSLVDCPLHIGAVQAVAAIYLAIGWAPEQRLRTGKREVGGRGEAERHEHHRPPRELHALR